MDPRHISSESIGPSFFCIGWKTRPAPGSRGSVCPDRFSSACRDSRYCSTHNTCQTAYLRKVHGETVVIIHPCHPLNGQSVDILHLRSNSHILVELPNGSAQVIPVSWTDRSIPNIHKQCKIEGLCLSPFALLEAAEWLRKTK